ncbi:MAG: galactokinase [Candidatus Binatus sp.]|uniref:galactokinase n=1 Tax=Candidatus Binatus sp. TaxID=2811406 RepID=UPI003BAF17AA
MVQAKKEAPMNLPDGWDDEELARVRKLAARLGASGRAQIIAARAPGRVNLIGEHTDYSGLPVLPVAIDRSTIVVAAANTTSEIEVSNADPAWQSRRFAIERQIPPYATGDWANYLKAAIQGVIDHFPGRHLRGMSMVVGSTVPPASGLSSSSALTVSTAMVFMAINGLELEPIETATMVARSERYVGTHGGAMDQSVSILGRRDHALFIEFNPIRVRAVKMPANAALVVADSLEVADKSGKVRAEYNRRVVECSLAARILGRALNLDGVKILGDVVRAIPNWSAVNLVEKLAATSPARLDANLKEAANILGVSQTALDAELLGHGSTRIELDSNRPLEILKRARHVLSETERVIRAADVLNAGRLDEMGTLMNASHQSLAEDFECSTSRLDAIVECARRGGAIGARLTGAGFGGSIVALCDVENASAVIESIDRGYYEKFALGALPENLRAVLHAGPGASVIDLSANA